MIRKLVRKLSRTGEKLEKGARGGGWIGVDLDGTLARFDGWYGPAHIGEPIKPMVERVKKWLDEGVEVRIFTARASVPEYIPYVERWLEKEGLPPLKVTNIKDFSMICLWDDRCIEVVTNSGEVMKRVDDNTFLDEPEMP